MRNGSVLVRMLRIRKSSILGCAGMRNRVILISTARHNGRNGKMMNKMMETVSSTSFLFAAVLAMGITPVSIVLPAQLGFSVMAVSFIVVGAYVGTVAGIAYLFERFK